MLISNKEKSTTLKTTFRVKRAQRLTFKSSDEVHLHINLSSVFTSLSLYLVDSDILEQALSVKHTIIDKCYEIVRQLLRWLDTRISDLYTYLLLPFVDVFCFFAVDLSRLRAIARSLA